MRERIRMNILEGSRDFSYEYGSIIYYQNGEICHTEIKQGHRDYEGFSLFTGKGDRTTLRNGKYYRYDVNNAVVWEHPYDTKDCGYDYWLWFDSGSYPAGEEINKLAEGAIPLEVVHYHFEKWYLTDEYRLSVADKIFARSNDVNVSSFDSENIDVYKP